MAQMGRVKASAKKSDAAATRVGPRLHLPIVSRRDYAKRSASIGLIEMRYLIALLALAGVVVSALALRVHYDTGTEPCSINEKWDCGIVNHSPFAMIGPVPVAAIGIAGYLALTGLALARKRSLLAIASVLGLGFALYLSHIEKSVLEVWCLYCVISQAIIALMTILSIGWKLSERWSKGRT
jgi:vitamin-K-epoxide reductase (warfarin-sensitive)